jgi:hypothetical protein
MCPFLSHNCLNILSLQVYFISALLCNGLDNIQTAVKVLCFQVLFEDDVHGTIEINDLKDKVINHHFFIGRYSFHSKDVMIMNDNDC